MTDQYALAKIFVERFDVNQPDNDGNTPLHLAADMHFSSHTPSSRKRPSNRMIDMLVDQGADRTKRNWDGAIPKTSFPEAKYRPAPPPGDPSLGGYRPLNLGDIPKSPHWRR